MNDESISNNVKKISSVNGMPLSKGSDGYNKQQCYVMKNHLPDQTLCSIYGPSGSYKSFLAVSWACHIATGVNWAGNKVNQGAVVYIVGEGGIGVSRRVKAWENIYQKEAANLWLVNRPVFPVRRSEISTLVELVKYIEDMSHFPVRLIIFDTLARCFGGKDENDARDMGAFIEGCDSLKNRTSATVLVVHHSGKDESKGARGSSSFRAALDVEFNVKREAEEQALVLSCTKMKDAEEPKSNAYELQKSELFVDTDGESVSSLAVIDSARRPKYLFPELSEVSNLTLNHKILWGIINNRLENGEKCTKKSIRDDLKSQGIDIKHFTRWLKKLVDDGALVDNGEEILLPSLPEAP